MDPIGNLLTTIRNASAVKKKRVYVPYSNQKLAILKILQEKGYIKDLKKIGKAPKFKLRFEIVYKDGIPKFEILKRISKPSRRIYSGYKNIKLVPPGFYIISTSRGLITDQEAKKRKLGGELICYIR